MQIYVGREGDQRGPYSLEQIQQYLAQGGLQLTDSAWYEGLDRWIPLSEVPGVRVVHSAGVPGSPGKDADSQGGRDQHSKRVRRHIFPVACMVIGIASLVAALFIFNEGPSVLQPKETITRTEAFLSFKGDVKLDLGAFLGADVVFLGGDFEGTYNIVEEEEILVRDDDEVIKVKVSILREIMETKIQNAKYLGQPIPTAALGVHLVDEIERGVLEGQTIIGQKKSGRWEFNLQTGEPTKEEEEDLAVYAEDFGIEVPPTYPGHEVSVGDSWNVPINKFLKEELGNLSSWGGPDEVIAAQKYLDEFFQTAERAGVAPKRPPSAARLYSPPKIAELDNISGSWLCTLKGFVDHKNKKHALIVDEINLKVSYLEKNRKRAEVEISLQGHHYRDLDNHIDVDVELEGQISGQASALWILGQSHIYDAFSDQFHPKIILSGRVSLKGTESVR